MDVPRYPIVKHIGLPIESQNNTTATCSQVAVYLFALMQHVDMLFLKPEFAPFMLVRVLGVRHIGGHL